MTKQNIKRFYLFFLYQNNSTKHAHDIHTNSNWCDANFRDVKVTEVAALYRERYC